MYPSKSGIITLTTQLDGSKLEIHSVSVPLERISTYQFRMTSLSHDLAEDAIIPFHCQTLVFSMSWSAVVVAGRFAIVVYLFLDLVTLRSLDLDVMVLYPSSKGISRLSTRSERWPDCPVNGLY